MKRRDNGERGWSTPDEKLEEAIRDEHCSRSTDGPA